MNNSFEKGKAFDLASLVDYEDGGIVSKQIIGNDGGNVTLFSFAEGQKLSEHSAPFDALVQILDGSAEIKIGGRPVSLAKGESVIMPAGIPHEVKACGNFKMLLTIAR